MPRTWPRIVAIALGCLSLSPAAPSHRRASDGLPDLVLWAWERPTDLRDLDSGTGVAFLAQTIVFDDDTFVVEPRRNPLRVSPSTPLIAVTRIEHRGTASPSLRRIQLSDVADVIARSKDLPQVRGLQIDFDAVESERALYRALLSETRRHIGTRVPLSITALASWCADDRWLEHLPIDEAVPMLFRMGPANGVYASMAISARSADSTCLGALGTSLDEPLPVRANGRRLYVFSSSPWTVKTVARAKRLRW